MYVLEFMKAFSCELYYLYNSSLLYLDHSELDLTVSASEVSVHSSVTFTCTVSGTPLPNVTWFANTTNYHQQLSSTISGVQITNTDKGETLSSKLTLVSVNRFDAGKYTCLATNQIRSTSGSLTLSIRCKLFAFEF